MFYKSPEAFIQQIVSTRQTDPDTLRKILNLEKKNLLSLLYITDKIRQHFFGNKIGLCSIMNAKSGGCSEDCIFCTQSSVSNADIEHYNFKSAEDITSAAEKLSFLPVKRFGVVTSGRSLKAKDIEEFKKALDKNSNKHPSFCASLGILDYKALKELKDNGLKRYHHNLETSESMFGKICTTHSYQKRIDTVKNAKAAGLKVCSGGIFGLGETDDQIVEMALALKDIDADSVPVNFLVPVKGTPAENFNYLTPYKSLLIIAMLRIALPEKEIIICGGRKENLKELYPFIFYAGATNLMTGDYLTTSGENIEADISWIKELGFETDH
ncbi:MAG: biotin synthase BioB [Thermodesulfobacteriota bacterium]